MSALDEARWLFAQIVQIHSTDHGDPLERCMELARQGYDLTRRAASVDTHAERCDVKQAQPARVGSAVGEAETPKPSQGAEQQQCRSGR